MPMLTKKGTAPRLKKAARVFFKVVEVAHFFKMLVDIFG